MNVLFLFLLFFNLNGLDEPQKPAVDFSGSVLDAVTMYPVPYAYLHLEELNRSVTTGRDGGFRFQNIPEGEYTLHIHRIGYETRKESIQMGDVSDNEKVIYLVPVQLRGDAIVVEDSRDEGFRGNVEHASVKIIGQDLRRNLGSTLSQTLKNVAGMSEETMGTAPGRPVIRGLGGERVLILKDGMRSGDVSTTSPDHAVTIDPMLAEEIQIARGPAALVYGGNAVGGVVNVVQNSIPTSVVTRTSGSFSLQGLSVNSEASAGGQLTLPLKESVALRLNMNGKIGQNLQTPNAEITNSHIRSAGSTTGLSYVKSWGYIGGAFSTYNSAYGIPPDAESGHPEGVDIELQQYGLTLRGEYLMNESFIHILEPEMSISYYNHQEIEANGSVGTEYDQFVFNTGLKARHKPWGFFDSGIIGTSVNVTDYRVFGARTPDSWQLQNALYVVQEADINRLHIELGARFDFVHSAPYEDRNSPVIGQISSQSHLGLSSSVSAIYNLFDGFYAGTTLLHSFRAPSLEELFSEGPHLAAYSFEIGNPNLDAERGFAKEIFVRYKGNRANVQLTGYRNYFWNYIYARDTGRRNFRFPDLNDFQFEEAEAIFLGAELSADIKLNKSLSVGGSAFYTVANRKVSEDEQQITGFDKSTKPLPQIPPFMGSIFASFQTGNWSFRGQVRLADKQDRLDDFETATKGYELLDFSAQYLIQGKTLLHTFALNIENIFNTEYRNHLSRIKHIYPEPGRNVSLLYRIYF